MKDKIEFMVGSEKHYVLKPTQEQIAQAEFVYKTKYSEALRYGALTHHEATRIIEERNLFTKEDGKKSGTLLMKVGELGHKLEGEVSITEGLDILTQIDVTRREILMLNRRRNAILDNTAESYADEQRLHFYIVQTTFKQDGEPAFTGTDNLICRSDEEVTISATRYVIYMVANGGEDFRSEWPDYQWRLKNGLVDENMNPVEEIPAEMQKKLEEEQEAAKPTPKKRAARKATKKKATAKKTTG